jgi:hypothetical protein
VYRDRKLLDLARGAPCMLRIPDVCNNDPATTVACHSNNITHGHGTSCKAHDCYFSLGCSACHSALDQGAYNRSDKDYWFQRGMERTWLWLWETGRVQVCDEQRR